jgi:hypothetical protein
MLTFEGRHHGSRGDYLFASQPIIESRHFELVPQILKNSPAAAGFCLAVARLSSTVVPCVAGEAARLLRLHWDNVAKGFLPSVARASLGAATRRCRDLLAALDRRDLGGVRVLE